MRKKLLAALIVALFCPLLLQARTKEGPDTISARRAFVEMPALVLDLLPKDTRLDMLDFYDVDSVWQAKNEFGGNSSLQTVAPDYLKVKITPVSDLQIKVLRNSKGNDVVMTIYTTGDDEGSRDSEVRFYDTSMQELDARKYFEAPRLRDFFEIPKGSITKMKEIEELIPFYTIEYTAAPGSNAVEGRLTIGELLTMEDMKIVSLFMKPEIKLLWNGNKLKS